MKTLLALATLLLATSRTAGTGYDAKTQPFSASRQQASVVNVNTATPTQLQYLPHVGTVLAGRILAARPFAAPADLGRVKGIGHGKWLASLLPYVTVTGSTTAMAKLGGGK